MLQTSHFPSSALLAAVALAPFYFFDQAEAAGNGCFERHDPQFVGASFDGLDLSFLEAGNPANPTLVMLQDFRDPANPFGRLSPQLAQDFHIIAPDYENLRLSGKEETRADMSKSETAAVAIKQLLERRGVTSYALYLTDHGSDVGYDVFALAPEKVTGFIVSGSPQQQSKLRHFWIPVLDYWSWQADTASTSLQTFLNIQDAKWQFTIGMRSPQAKSPDDFWYAQILLAWDDDREVQLPHILNFGRDAARHVRWQKILNEFQPPALVVWEPAETERADADPYSGKAPVAVTPVDFQLQDGGTYGLAEDTAIVAQKMTTFLDRITSR